jgi:hypothetical protein
MLPSPVTSQVNMFPSRREKTYESISHAKTTRTQVKKQYSAAASSFCCRSWSRSRAVSPLELALQPGERESCCEPRRTSRATQVELCFIKLSTPRWLHSRCCHGRATVRTDRAGPKSPRSRQALGFQAPYLSTTRLRACFLLRLLAAVCRSINEIRHAFQD